jgi:hypothetical protein
MSVVACKSKAANNHINTKYSKDATRSRDAMGLKDLFFLKFFLLQQKKYQQRWKHQE